MRLSEQLALIVRSAGRRAAGDTPREPLMQPRQEDERPSADAGLSVTVLGTPVALDLRYAYNPKNGPGGDGRKGKLHWVVLQDLRAGRLVRRTGDALCKPRDRFWSLQDPGVHAQCPRICPRCRQLAARLVAAGKARFPAGHGSRPLETA